MDLAVDFIYWIWRRNKTFFPYYFIPSCTCFLAMMTTRCITVKQIQFNFLGTKSMRLYLIISNSNLCLFIRFASFFFFFFLHYYYYLLFFCRVFRFQLDILHYECSARPQADSILDTIFVERNNADFYGDWILSFIPMFLM